MINTSARNEMNFLHARQLALANEWWKALVGCMLGLRYLNTELSNSSKWKVLVEEIIPAFVEPITDGPLPGRENGWRFIMEYRAAIAGWEGRDKEAERLLGILLDRQRRVAAGVLALAPGDLTENDRTKIENLAVVLQDLGVSQMNAYHLASVETLREGLELRVRIGNKTGVAICASFISKAYMKISQLQDFEKAEYWCRRALENVQPSDHKLLSDCHRQLGEIAYEHFRDTIERQTPEREWRAYLSNALQEFNEALRLQPPYLVAGLGELHGHLGNVYAYLDQIDQALNHFRESIRFQEHLGHLCDAAATRLNVAVALLNAKRHVDAGEYARAALRHFEFCDSCEGRVLVVKELLSHIDLRQD